jgi:predicted GIY-YIG superfamily endonuclease
MARGFHHHVYVVELSREVWYEPRFRRANPDYDPRQPCVYVGMTGLNPDARFDKHKAGIKANRFVKQYGLRLMPELYECFNPMPYRAACEMEVELGIGLREQGYGVWQG